MGVLTNLLKLLKPGENDYYNQQTEQADNWDKVDNYAVLTNTDKNGIWGGEYGGYIQDPIPKELNKRYIDNINGKAFICIKAGDSSVVSNTIEYFTPCNVVDNLGKLKNLTEQRNVDLTSAVLPNFRANNNLYCTVLRKGDVVMLSLHDAEPINSQIPTRETVVTIPQGYRPAQTVELVTATTGNPSTLGIRCLISADDGTLSFVGSGSGYVPNIPHSVSFTYFTNDI